jgi:hypothetical protein
VPSLAELEALAPAERSIDLYLTARWVVDFVGFVADDLDTVEVHGARTLAMAREANNRTIQCIAGTMMAQIALLRGRNADAQAHADRALEIAETIGNLNVFPAAASVALLARTALGVPADVDDYLDRIDRGLDPHGLVQMNLRFINEAWLLAGNVERFLPRAEMMRETGGGRIRRALLALAHADLLSRAGRVEAARDVYAEALALSLDTPMRSLLAQVVVGAASLGAAGLSLVRPHIPTALAACRALSLERYGGAVERALLAGLEYPITAQGESRA